ncbi:hypothetical protein EU803_13930 [Loktanella sp. IMCC34160]|uniref:hypothetical protein n=1 Tax=Loktanella sp. IMCC34160 TaxID=2510646 RepID=UPI00101CC2A0|nr:hypothetical protein [Loktanella sp. IMCC34160]RYG90322.1 hypothetical protein EU803_13930 [Loktanella sp. IMCC34160]
MVANVCLFLPQKAVKHSENDCWRPILPKAELSHLAVAKKLADDSGRHISECMDEAAEIIIRSQREPQLPKIRALYLALAGMCSALVLNSVSSILNVGSILPDPASLGLLALVLVGMFWVTPEIPLMSKLWTRWNTPAFIAAMVIVLCSNHPLARAVNDIALVLFLGVAVVAAVNGSRHPDRALEKRPYTTKFLFHELSAEDQGRIFFLAPWLTPFGLGSGKRR